MDKEKFAEMSINEFAERLGSGDPTPGGGAAAALGSAMGAALIMMVANHTIGREKYAEFEELNSKVLKEAEEIRARLLAGIDRDAEVFGNLSGMYHLPEGTEERTKAVASASVDAAEAPLAVMEDSLRGLELALSLLGNSNVTLQSDIYVAALNLITGIKCAGYNVAANLPSIREVYPDIAQRIGTRATEIMTASRELEREMSTYGK